MNTARSVRGSLRRTQELIRPVILKLDGNFNSGFEVTVKIAGTVEFIEKNISGLLPPAPKLLEFLDRWQKEYRRLEHQSRIKPKKIIYNRLLSSRKRFTKTANLFKTQFQCWLESPDFSPINKLLQTELQPQEAVEMILCSDRQSLWQLPWCCWNLVENHRKLEISWSSLKYKPLNFAKTLKTLSQVNILAILGNSQGINLTIDRTFLNSLKDGKVTFLVEPQRQQLYNYLCKENWDIIFFAGHSETTNKRGILYLNPEEQLTIDELRSGFQQAIAAGLQLAIFNSCDGLGLAYELGQLSLPQAIVMRFPIPDLIAHQFLKSFLTAYAAGNSLHLATRIAREQLKSLEAKFPCASWLPVIYQNPLITPPTWQDLRGD